MRKLSIFVLSILPLSISAAIIIDSVRLLSASATEISLQFEGAAYEDIFGFGLAPTLLFVMFIQTTALVLLWVLAPKILAKKVTIVAGALFLIASVMFYLEHQRTMELWAIETAN